MSEKGYLLLEVVIAMMIFVLVGLSIFTSIGFLQLRIKKSEYQEEAVSVLQEGMEIAQNAILVEWSRYSDGEYYPTYNASSEVERWELISGSETDLRGIYSRRLILKNVCRDDVSGDRIEWQGSVCPGDADPNSREISGEVSWKEGGKDVKIETSLLSFKIPE